MKIFKTILLILGVTLFVGCRKDSKRDTKNSIDIADSTAYRNYVSKLASDDFMGRLPFTKGEELTTEYLKEQFKKMGMEPGNNGSYFQDVPLVNIEGSFKRSKISFKNKSGESLDLKPLDEMVGLTRRAVPEQKIEDAPLVFAGFGIDAPEYKWNDFKNVDVKGKILVVMVNDPGFYNSDLFRGKNMTYYGRWTYKYEEAAKQGAAGVLIIHATAPASYGWEVVRSGWSGPNLYMQTDNNGADRCAIEGWVSGEGAKKLFDLAGKDFKKLTDAAKKTGFEPVDLGITLSTTLENKVEKKKSKNVVAVWPGTDLKDQYIIYSAHWDHFGIAEPVDGDSIYNGAVDNASGTAGLLTLAKMYARNPKPRRSILFLAVTGEEQGLLGSEYYANNPIYPLKNTVADINMDVLQPFGKMKDIMLIGKGLSNIDQYLLKAAKDQHREVRVPEDQSNGWYFRSDHFSFAKVGIPALYIGTGVNSVKHGEAWGKKKSEDYNAHRYHKPQDEYSPDWDVSGTMEDLKLIYNAGRDLAETAEFPTWNDGVMFKKVRTEQRGE